MRAGVDGCCIWMTLCSAWFACHRDKRGRGLRAPSPLSPPESAMRATTFAAAGSRFRHQRPVTLRARVTRAHLLAAPPRCPVSSFRRSGSPRSRRQPKLQEDSVPRHLEVPSALQLRHTQMLAGCRSRATRLRQLETQRQTGPRNLAAARAFGIMLEARNTVRRRPCPDDDGSFIIANADDAPDLSGPTGRANGGLSLVRCRNAATRRIERALLCRPGNRRDMSPHAEPVVAISNGCAVLPRN
jgi:hypothetical protein